MGKTAFGLVELVGLFKTVTDLTGIGVPPEDVDGTSFAALVSDPDSGGAEGAFSQYPRRYVPGSKSYSLVYALKEATATSGEDAWRAGAGLPAYEGNPDLSVMGYSVRTADWRFTTWYAWNCTSGPLAPLESELYNHTGDTLVDMGSHENENLYAPMQGSDVVRYHRALLESNICTTRPEWCVSGRVRGSLDGGSSRRPCGVVCGQEPLTAADSAELGSSKRGPASSTMRQMHDTRTYEWPFIEFSVP